MSIAEYFYRPFAACLMSALVSMFPLGASRSSSAQVPHPGSTRPATFRSSLLSERLEPTALNGEALSPAACNTQIISFGQTINDRLHNGDCGTDRLFDRYQFTGNAGQAIDLSMSSNVFDTYLELYDPSGQRIASNYDSGIGLNSHLGIVLPATGNYLILASSFELNQTGSYSITLRNALTISGLTRELEPGAPPIPLSGATVTATNLSGNFSTSVISGADGSYVLVLPGIIDSYRVTAVRNGFSPIEPFRIFNDLSQNQIYDIDFTILVTTGAVSGSMGVRSLSTTGLAVRVSGPSIVSSDCFLSNFDALHDVEFDCYGLPLNGTFTFTRTSTLLVFDPASFTVTSLQGSLQNVIFGGPTLTINPLPATAGLSPAAAIEGAGPLTLTVTGSYFIEGSVIRWNDQDRSTTFVSSTTLTAQISAEDLQSSGIIPITVFNPPYGGGESNAIGFSVNSSFASISGRVLTPDMRGLRNAKVSITDSHGVRRTVTTSSFGLYSFDNVDIGGNYTISVASKLYRFQSRQMQVDGGLTNIDFVGQE